MKERDEFEVHPEHSGNQVQRQENGCDRGEGAHDVIGPVALRIEVHLNRGFDAVLKALDVV